jgi:hypothetical protein
MDWLERLAFLMDSCLFIDSTIVGRLFVGVTEDRISLAASCEFRTRSRISVAVRMQFLG